MPLTTGFYMVELSNLKARIWQPDHTVVQYTSADLVLTTTIATAELFECQARVVNDELFIVHKNHKPQRIKASTPAPFAIDEPTFTGDRTFSTTNNFPSTVAAFRGSLVLGATIAEPTGYFISKAPTLSTGAFNTTVFALGSATASDAIIGYNTDGFGSKINWIQGHRRLVAGMTNTVYADSGALPTPTNFYMQVVSYRGASQVQAAILENGMFYVGSPIPTLQMLVYSLDAGGMTDIEASRFNRHLLKAGVTQLAAMASPETLLWALRPDGKAAVFAVDSGSQSVTIGGALYELPSATIESIGVSRTATGDELWLWVNRSGVRCCETLKFPTDNDLDFTELHYVDAGIRWAGSPATSVSGLTHLNGKTVHAIGDGASMPAVVVSGGVATYTKSFSKIHVGLPNESISTPTRPEVQANATWQGKKKNVERVTLRISNSYGGKVAAGADPEDLDFQTIPYTGGPFQEFGAEPAPITTDVHLDVGGNVDEDGVVTVKQDEPFPMTLLALITRIKIVEA
jgi:hypothetical protein